jgi:hypothetical protein
MELIVKLKQHTPIIHFQWEQTGATLRATELKPKLDRYIRKKYYKDDQNVRLKYQLRIRYLTPLIIGGTQKQLHRDSMFFGNLNQPEDKKKWEIYGSELELRFNTYFDADLKKQIEKALPTCLALENFGTRNNKGNGCFFHEDKTINDFEAVLKQYAPSSVYYWDCASSDALFCIKTVYSLLKSGINLTSNPILSQEDYNKLRKGHANDFKLLNSKNLIKPIDSTGYYAVFLNIAKKKNIKLSSLVDEFLKNMKKETYYKSLLFKYFKGNNITWDKKAIKMMFLPTVKSDGWYSNDQKFVRGLLGISDVQSWHTYDKTLTINSDVFERVPSPIVFKIFDKGDNTSRVYFFARDFYKNLLGKTFEFTMPPYSGNLILSVPSSFDISNFLDYAVNEINNLTINNVGIPTGGLVKRVDEIITEIKSSGIRKL